MKQFELTPIDCEFLNQLNTIIEITHAQAGAAIQLICKQNGLEGKWQFDPKDGNLIKVE